MQTASGGSLRSMRKGNFFGWMNSIPRWEYKRSSLRFLPCRRVRPEKRLKNSNYFSRHGRTIAVLPPGSTWLLNNISQRRSYQSNDSTNLSPEGVEGRHSDVAGTDLTFHILGLTTSEPGQLSLHLRSLLFLPCRRVRPEKRLKNSNYFSRHGRTIAVLPPGSTWLLNNISQRRSYQSNDSTN